MSSTAEVKDAIRMAQQYNIHIYKYLINGLVDSSLTATKLRAELEVSCHIHIIELQASQYLYQQVGFFKKEARRGQHHYVQIVYGI